MNSSSQQDMTMVWLSGVILLVLLLAFSYSSYSTCFCSQQSVEQNVTKSDFKSLTETLFTTPVPVATPMPFVVQPSELVVPSVGGIVLQGGTNNYIRVAGTATTDATRNTVGTSNNQIQIYNSGNLTAAFDVDGLYVKALNTGSGTISCGAITSTGASSFGSITGTGAISCGAITSTGASSFGSITGTGAISCGAITCGSITANGTLNSSLLFQNTSKFWYTGIRGDTSDEYAIYNDALRLRISQSGTVNIPGTLGIQGTWPQITLNAAASDVGINLVNSSSGSGNFSIAVQGPSSGAGSGNGSLYFYQNTAGVAGIRMYIDSAGKVNIPGTLGITGATTVGGTLNVTGALKATGSGTFAWGYFTVNSTTATLVKGFNVSSMTMLATTYGTVNFTNPAPDSSYCVVANATHSNGSTPVSANGYFLATTNFTTQFIYSGSAIGISSFSFVVYAY
jgi:fibronectin-binding autotransporter adhesin